MKTDIKAPDWTKKECLNSLNMLKDAIEAVVESNPEGVKNSELARITGLESDHNGGQKNYLTYSILGLLLKEGRIYKDIETGRYRKTGR